MTKKPLIGRGWLSHLLGRRPERRVPLVLYTRADCPLCDAMKAEIARAGIEGLATLDEVDIASDPALEQRYGRSIPVLAIAGRPAFKGRLTAGELRAKLLRAAT